MTSKPVSNKDFPVLLTGSFYPLENNTNALHLKINWEVLEFLCKQRLSELFTVPTWFDSTIFSKIRFDFSLWCVISELRKKDSFKWSQDFNIDFDHHGSWNFNKGLVWEFKDSVRLKSYICAKTFIPHVDKLIIE